MELPEETVEELLALAGVPLAHDDLTAALQEVCRIATRGVRNAAGASLTSFETAGPQAVAASDEWAEQLDEMQYDEREGPCIDASRSGVLFRVRDTCAEPRWPSYMPRACEHGARSMLSIPMTVETKTIAALNVYSREVDGFGPEEVSIAEIIAGHATLATQITATLQGHKEIAEQLREAMASRAGIEQAKGIIMGSARCTPDEAFDLLVQQSQAENRKLRDLADDLVARQKR